MPTKDFKCISNITITLGRIVLLASEGLSIGQISEVMGISKSVVTYVVNKWRRTGLVEPH
jgi:transposase